MWERPLRGAAAIALAALLAACGGGSDSSSQAVSGGPRASALDLLGPVTDLLAPAGDLGGADTEAPPDHRRRSLYSGPAPRPGPDLLYADPPVAPQLQNTGIWRAAPILVSGASAYRKGEFLYQDFLYDDRGANGSLPDPDDDRGSSGTFSKPAGTYTYPTDAAYAGNAADFVELRVKPQSQFTAFRVTLNTLIDPHKVAFTIAIGDSAAAQPWPFGANVRSPAQRFLTVHGSQAVLTDAATGAAVSPAPSVTIDLQRRQYEVRVPHAAWNPGQQRVRLAAGIGLWDAAAHRYLLPALARSSTVPGGAGRLAQPPAFFNVAFRFDEPMWTAAQTVDRNLNGNSYWRESAQSQALAAGDISRFHAVVDFARLAARHDDDMAGQPQGVPVAGPINRIFASHVETKQGADFSVDCGSFPVCKGQYRGQLQPYALYVPSKPQPAAGWGFTLLLHSLGGNHNQYLNSRNQSQLGERGTGHLVATPLGRGPDGWYVDDAAADTFEVWADVARHYPLDAAMTAISGYSMGGHGTFKFATRYPDLFAKAFTVVGPPGLGIWLPPAAPTGGAATLTNDLLPGLRHIPILMWVQAADELVPYTGTLAQAQTLDELGYRYRFDTFTSGEHLTLALNDEYQIGADFMGDALVDRNPARVTFVAAPVLDVPGRQLVGDHAYWVSGVRARDAAAANGRASVDAVSRAFGQTDPIASATQLGAGVIGGNLGVQVFNSRLRTWTLPGVAPAADRLDIVARNVASLVVHPQRARLSCNAQVLADSDGPLTVELAGCGRTLRF